MPIRLVIGTCFARFSLARWSGGWLLTALLGVGGIASAATPSTATPMVGVGVFHSCALNAAGAVFCWGSNLQGQLGGPARSPVPVRVSALPPATSLAVGSHHACAVVVADGAVRCWGSNDFGQLGIDGLFERYDPVEVVGIRGASAVASGWYHSCALVGGAIKCWGYNFSGQLGNGSTANSTAPVDVMGIDNAVGISVAGFHSCAVLATGSVQCWGDNRSGQLGDGTELARPVPARVVDIQDATAVAAGQSHTCAIVQGGAVQCWGLNENGQLGDGSDVRSSVPVPVVSQSGAVRLTAGYRHTCAALAGGKVQCWGYTDGGLLGNGGVGGGPPFFRSTAVWVSRLEDATVVSAGFYHSCAALSSGAVQCWGGNGYGQLGTGGYVGTTSPVTVLGEGATGALNLQVPLPDVAANADKVFAWAERTYPQYFLGSAGSAGSNFGYRFRAYPAGAGELHYLAVNETGITHLFYLGPLSSNALKDLGLLVDFLPLAKE